MCSSDLLMLTVYARKDGPVHTNHLRWGFLLLGALAFLDAYAVWSGGLDRIPFGENANGLSDPSVLTEEYGWSPLVLQARYQRLATVCLVVLGCAYVGGLRAPLVSKRRAG